MAGQGPWRLTTPERPFNSRRSAVLGTHGMVATSQPLAAQAGLRILMQSGNAVDAAVATSAALNVVEPMATGIGGDAFALIYLADSRQVKALNASGRAPAAATIERYRELGLSEMPRAGILSVTVPGKVDGWVTLLEAHGTMSLGEVLAPAIDYARAGFPVSELISQGWRASASRLAQHPDSAATYLRDGRGPEPGEIVAQPNLARTLASIAAHGRAGFYSGETAEKIVAFSEREGGLLSLADLAGHTSTWVEPIAIDYNGYRVYECPPNGQGIATLIALQIAQGLGVGDLDHNSADYLHLMIEAMKLAAADTYDHVADPDFADVPVAWLLSTEHADQRRAAIDRERATQVDTRLLHAGSETAYLTTADRDGNAVSFINSLYNGFGSGLVAGDTGVCLQNRGALFSLDPAHPNRLEPGKRPLHTIIPAMVTRDDRLFMSFGLTGGPMQPQGQLQVLTNLAAFRMNLQQAIDAPRFRYIGAIDGKEHQGKVYLEAGIPPGVQQELEQRGHDVVPFDMLTTRFGGCQAIVVNPTNGALIGGSDPRKDGCVVAF